MLRTAVQRLHTGHLANRLDPDGLGKCLHRAASANPSVIICPAAWVMVGLSAATMGCCAFSRLSSRCGFCREDLRRSLASDGEPLSGQGQGPGRLISSNNLRPTAPRTSVSRAHD